MAGLVLSQPEVALPRGVAEARLSLRWPVCRANGEISRDRAGAVGDGAGLAAGAGTRSGKMAAAQEADGAGSAVVAAGGGSSGQVRRPRRASGVLPHLGVLPRGVSCPLSRNPVHLGLLAQRHLEYRAQAGPGGPGGQTVREAGLCCALGPAHGRAGWPPGSLLQPETVVRRNADLYPGALGSCLRGSKLQDRS